MRVILDGKKEAVAWIEQNIGSIHNVQGGGNYGYHALIEAFNYAKKKLTVKHLP